MKKRTVKAMDLGSAVGYRKNSIVSKTLLDNPAGSLTLFAFDAGQGLSEHTAPCEAAVQVLEGSVVLTIGGKKVNAKAGELVIMPAHVPHALDAPARFKMLLTMIHAEAEGDECGSSGCCGDSCS